MLNTEPEITASSTGRNTAVVHVCVAVIERLNEQTGVQEVLIAKRPEHVHQGGLWEFPGGKIEAGEPVTKALNRELFEELGIELVAGEDESPQVIAPTLKRLITIEHRYPEKTVLLDVWKVPRFLGVPYGKEGQTVRWVPLQDLTSYPFPEANLPIITACLLPNRYFITPAYPSVLDAQVGLLKALDHGAQLIYFRQPQLSLVEYTDWLNELVGVLPSITKKLMHQHVESWRQIPGAGVHLSFKEAARHKIRPIDTSCWLAVSCHNKEELVHAKKLNADFVTLSPVLPTASHPGQPGMGWQRFKQLLSQAALPVYGLGGLTDAHEIQLAESAAQGLAGIGFWQ